MSLSGVSGEIVVNELNDVVTNRSLEYIGKTNVIEDVLWLFMVSNRDGWSVHVTL